MANNVLVRDASGALITMKTLEKNSVHTPYQTVGSVEKKFRDNFGGATLDATKWDSVVGNGGSITASVGSVNISSGTTASSETSITSKDTFQIPFRISFAMSMSQRIANQSLIVEAISVDATTGVPDGKSSCAWVFDGTSATQAKYRVQDNAMTPLDSAPSTVVTTANGTGHYEIEPFADETWFHSTVLDSVNSRISSYRRHQQIPDPNSVYKIRVRWVNAATAPASSSSAVFQFIGVQDYQELTAEITAGRGQSSAGQSMAVSVVSAPTTAVTGTVSLVNNLTAVAGAITASGQTISYNNANSGCVAIAVYGTYAGLNMTFEASNDNTNWFPVVAVNMTSGAVSSTTGALASNASVLYGAFMGGMSYIRVRATAYTSGTANITINPTPEAATNFVASIITGTVTVSGTVTANDVSQNNVFYNESTTNLAGAATFTGTTRDTGVAAAAVHRYCKFNAFALADQAGTLRIEVSNNNTTWFRATADTAVAANTPVILSVPTTTRYHRVVFINGATAQTSFLINSSYTQA